MAYSGTALFDLGLDIDPRDNNRLLGVRRMIMIIIFGITNHHYITVVITVTRSQSLSSYDDHRHYFTVFITFSQSQSLSPLHHRNHRDVVSNNVIKKVLRLPSAANSHPSLREPLSKNRHRWHQQIVMMIISIDIVMFKNQIKVAQDLILSRFCWPIAFLCEHKLPWKVDLDLDFC